MIAEIKFKLKNGMTLEVNENGFAIFDKNECWVMDGSMFADKDGTIAIDNTFFNVKKNVNKRLTILTEKK